LSGRFLELLFAGVEPRAILATTFTRKAAGEIQDRVLARLAEAVSDAKKRAELSAQVGRALTADDVETLLARLTRRLGELSVRTLDSFFVHLARLFALELGLPPDWSIVDEVDDRALRREAVARTLAATERVELLVLLRGLQRADASRSVERVLLREVEHGRDAFLDSHPEAWSRVKPAEGASDAEVEAALARLARLALPTTKAGEPDKSWTKERDGLLERVRAREWETFATKGLGQKVITGQTSYQRREIPDSWLVELELLAQRASHELIGEVAAFNAAALGWLERFETSYEALKAEERAYRFEDLPKALHPRETSRLGEREQIWYRLDGKIDHLLLDEFQDTAPVQWRILEHLASEILADGTGTRSFFCVGDLKQSIYGFREAEPRLLGEMGARYEVLEVEKMSASRRSAPVVLDTVNRVFLGIADNPALEREPGQERFAAARAFRASYDEHVAADTKKPGWAVLLEAPEVEGEDEEKQSAVLALAARRARALADEAPGATIGILLRRNELIARMIFLLRDQGLRASGEGGNPLTDSAAVLHFLSLLHLSDHPGDSAAAFHVATSPLAAAAGLTRENYVTARADVSFTLRARLAAQGYGAFATALLPAVDEGYGAWDRRRFRQLIDLAHAHDERAGLRAGRFLDLVRVTRVEDPAATQVQVMTVHSAKGLEFDAVILPELDVKFSLKGSELFTHRPDPAGLLTAVSHARSEEICRLHPLLGELWSEREEREMREALSLLYVAMTRARHRLELLVQHRKDPTKVAHSYAGLLRAALGAFRSGADGLLWAHPDNAERGFVPRQAARESAPRAAPRRAPFRPCAEPPRVHRTPSAAEGGGQRFAGELLRAPHAPARRAGDLVHLWLSRIEWREDFRASDAELVALGRRLCDDETLLTSTCAEFRAFLARPNLAAELARRAECQVWRERPFELTLSEPDGREAHWSGSFDRVVLTGRPGAWNSARIVDWKTDQLASGAVAERVEHYRPQLASYRRVLAAMTGLAEERIETGLFFLRLDEFHPL
ncbi:MAG: UvrD-helicase domain-containing protein, partial [Planctomycetota bacterium]